MSPPAGIPPGDAMGPPADTEKPPCTYPLEVRRTMALGVGAALLPRG